MAVAPAEEVFHSRGLWWQKPQPWSWETSQAIAFPRGSRSGHMNTCCFQLSFADVLNMFYLRLLIVLEAVGVISKCIVQFCQQDPWVQVDTLRTFIIISKETSDKVECEVGYNKATFKDHEGKALQNKTTYSSKERQLSDWRMLPPPLGGGFKYGSELDLCWEGRRKKSERY